MAKKKAISNFMNMVKSWLDEGNVMSIQLDLVHYFIESYDKMANEDEEYADMINFYLIEQGLEAGEGFSDKKFLALMKKQYKEVKKGVW